MVIQFKKIFFIAQLNNFNRKILIIKMKNMYLLLKIGKIKINLYKIKRDNKHLKRLNFNIKK